MIKAFQVKRVSGKTGVPAKPEISFNMWVRTQAVKRIREGTQINSGQSQVRKGEVRCDRHLAHKMNLKYQPFQGSWRF